MLPLALFIAHTYVGAFFAVAGYRKLTVRRPAWHQMCRAHKLPGWFRDVLPITQLLGGIVVVLSIPVLLPLAAFGLLLQMIGAFWLTTLPGLQEDFGGRYPDRSGFWMNAMQSAEALLGVFLLVFILV